MLALEIVLIVTGLFFFALSFFVTEKLSDSDIDYIKKLSEKEIGILLDKELSNASSKIEKTIDEKTEDAIKKIEAETDKDTNDKLLSIGEYGDTVIKNFNENSEKTLESVNKSHDQITFIYSMLSDKEEKINKLSKKLEYEEQFIKSLKSNLDEKEKNIKKLNLTASASEYKYNMSDFKSAPQAKASDDSKNKGRDIFSEISEKEENRSTTTGIESAKAKNNENEPEERITAATAEVNNGFEASSWKNKEKEDSGKTEDNSINDLAELKQAFEKELKDEKSTKEDKSSNGEKKSGEKSLNDKVLTLYKQGYSEVEIAKSLGKGVGEVKLILGLFDEGKKS